MEPVALEDPLVRVVPKLSPVAFSAVMPLGVVLAVKVIGLEASLKEVKLVVISP
jgi:hypothetical protein